MSADFKPGDRVRRLSWRDGFVLQISEVARFGLHGQLFINGQPNGSANAFWSFKPSDMPVEFRPFELVPAERVDPIRIARDADRLAQRIDTTNPQPGELLRVAVTLEILTPAFDPRAVVVPGWQSLDRTEGEGPLTALDEFALGVREAVQDALGVLAPDSQVVSYSTRTIERLAPPDPNYF